METGSVIVSDALVLTCDGANRGGRFSIAVCNGRIEDICETTEQCRAKHPGLPVLEARGRLVVPGFVNVHVHSHSLLLREVTQGLHFATWETDPTFTDAVSRLADPAHCDDLMAVYHAAYASHVLSGTTCTGEFPMPVADSVYAALHEVIRLSGVRAVMTLQTWDQIAYARERAPAGSRFTVDLGNEKDYTVYSFETLLRAARELQVPSLAHVAERREDVEVVRRNFQKNVLAVLRDCDALRASTVLVHLNHLGEQDAQLLEEAGGTATLCLLSTARKRTGYPFLKYLPSRRIRLSLGTDWGSTDVMREMDFLAQLPLLMPGMPSYSPVEILRMATINGAFALGLSSEIGSIEVGKKADLVLFDLDPLRVGPLRSGAGTRDLARLLVTRLTVRDITDVMINGDFVVRDRKLTRLNEADVSAAWTSVHDRLFGDRLPVPAQQRGLTAKILPFAPRERTEQPEENFAAGFQPAPSAGPDDEPGERAINMQQPPLPATAARPQPKPGARGGTIRVFGDDDVP